MDEAKVRSKLKVLNESLDELEEKLEPLLAQTLPETLVGLEDIQQAKLQTDITYVVYDLIFIYLKTRGIDPKTHPVIGELDRVRQYFDKIKKVEEGPEKGRNALDQGAANRFIKHAIAQVNLQRPPGDAEAGPSDVRVPTKVTSKMLARAKYDKELEELGDQEESDLEVFNDDSREADVEMEEAETSSGKGKDKAKTTDGVSAGSAGKKRRRPAVDPFAGYGDSPTGSSMDGLASGQSMPGVSAGGSTAKDQKKAAKKARKKAKRTTST